MVSRGFFLQVFIEGYIAEDLHGKLGKEVTFG
jgi:hypothetical protein